MVYFAIGIRRIQRMVERFRCYSEGRDTKICKMVERASTTELLNLLDKCLGGGKEDGRK